MMMTAHDETRKEQWERSVGGNSDLERNFWFIESMPDGLIDSPLDFIFAEHHRQRQAAQILSYIAGNHRFDEAGVQALVGFLQDDFALHVQDEELGFFPVLRTCCLPEDNIEAIIARLIEDHKKDESVSQEVLEILKKYAQSGKITPDESQRLHAFAEHIRQHLAFENAVLLPIARVRMDGAALACLSEDMKRRRR